MESFHLGKEQACKLICRLRELISYLCSDVCFEGRLAGLDKTETGNEPSQPKFKFTRLVEKEYMGLSVGAAGGGGRKELAQK